jgi:hypothetical protein
MGLDGSTKALRYSLRSYDNYLPNILLEFLPFKFLVCMVAKTKFKDPGYKRHSRCAKACTKYLVGTTGTACTKYVLGFQLTRRLGFQVKNSSTPDTLGQ